MTVCLVLTKLLFQHPLSNATVPFSNLLESLPDIGHLLHVANHDPAVIDDIFGFGLIAILFVEILTDAFNFFLVSLGRVSNSWRRQRRQRIWGRTG